MIVSLTSYGEYFSYNYSIIRLTQTRDNSNEINAKSKMPQRAKKISSFNNAKVINRQPVMSLYEHGRSMI